jgi:hypothetical protein
MRTALSLLFLLHFLNSCEKENKVSFEYDYSIIRMYQINDILSDSTVFFYNVDNQLLKIESGLHDYDASEKYVEYKDDFIRIGTKYYYLDSEGKIISINNLVGNRNEISYENNQLSSMREYSLFNDKLCGEIYPVYRNGVHCKDSIIRYEDGEQHVTVNSISYTDIRNPGFVIGSTGLFEYPVNSEYLTGEILQRFYGNYTLSPGSYLIKYSYKISGDKVVCTSHCYTDISMTDLHEVNTTTYLRIKNPD